MTAEKHPLEMVRDALERSQELEYNPFEPNNQSAHYNKVAKALISLTLYMGQTQSCAECERLGRENAKLREAVRDLAEGAGPLCQAVSSHKLFAEYRQSLLDCYEKHAATIAAAGGDDGR